MIGDRIGPKRVVLAACLLAGLAGALRGLAVDFATLMVAVLLFGLFSPMITSNTVKTCGMWFSRRQLGLANGVLSMGMALGFLLGSLFSATLLSPSLGGWRNVLILYGALSALLAIPWFFTRLPAKPALTERGRAGCPAIAAPDPGTRSRHPQRVAVRPGDFWHRQLRAGNPGLPAALFARSRLARGQRRRRAGCLPHHQHDLCDPHCPGIR